MIEPGQVVRVDTSSEPSDHRHRLIFSLLALIVGGIGVTNTMAMSVFERVHEIGIMRAVGWPRRRIAGLILCEAAGIGLLALCARPRRGLCGGAELFTQRGATCLSWPSPTSRPASSPGGSRSRSASR